MSSKNKPGNDLFLYLLRLGDTSLVLSHRLAEWCGHGPILEEDIAMTNISLDLIGQARILLGYASRVEGKGRSEDDLAYLREERAFYNVLLAEQPNGDFACTMVRQLFISSYQFFLFEALQKSADETIAAFAAKSLKEVTYHLRHSSEWVLRLGDGTAESREKTVQAVNELWMYTRDLFDMDSVDRNLLTAGIAPDMNLVKEKWEQKITGVLKESTIPVPPSDAWMASGSREGKHTEHLGYLLAEMQILPRTYPGASW